MKSLHTTFIVIMAVLLPGSALAQQTASTASDRGSALSGAAAQQDTAAQRGITEARQQIAADPKKVQAYNDLAIAYMRRARETADPQYLNDAASAVAHGLQLDADDFQLRRTEASVSLSLHRFAEARDRLEQEMLREGVGDVVKKALAEATVREYSINGKEVPSGAAN